MRQDRVCTVFYVVSKLCEILKETPIRDKVWEHKIDDHWFIKINGHSQEMKGIPAFHMTIEYERDLLSSGTHQDTLDRVFDFLGVRREVVETKWMRISSDEIEDMIENYDELVDELKIHSYDHYLDS